MHLIHTSDWHLGHRFHGRYRHAEQAAFLEWLADYIDGHQVDILLVAGDIFDTSTPGSRALTLYYRFLHRLAASSCRHVVVIAGNHDSPSLLEAPRELLQQLHIHVIGTVTPELDKELLLLDDEHGQPELLVGAVPFLRDRDIRTAQAGESLEDKGQKRRQGIIDHYQQLCARAEALRQVGETTLPLVVMGHLFVAGGRTVEGDGVRELALGGLDRVEGNHFPASIDYLALGHLHLGQRVQGSETRRYSGAPLPMGFNEAGQEKMILALEIEARTISVKPVPIPIFQELAVLRGDLPNLLVQLEEVRRTQPTAWVDLHYQGADLIPNLREQLHEAVAGSKLELLRIRTASLYNRTLAESLASETLNELEVDEVFERCLELHAITEEQRLLLRSAFCEITQALEADPEEQPNQS